MEIFGQVNQEPDHYKKRISNQKPENPAIQVHGYKPDCFSFFKSGSSQELNTSGNFIVRKPSPDMPLTNGGFQKMSSCDYLGLVGHPEMIKATGEAFKIYGKESGGVQRMNDINLLRYKLEKLIQEFKDTGSALVFNSGYQANITAITLLFHNKYRIIIDECVHHSFTEGLKIIGVTPEKFRHNDMNSLKELLEIPYAKSKTIIIVEAIYTYEGDFCPLDEIINLKEKHDAILLVDEAHSLGVLEKMGTGINEHFGISLDKVDIFTGSISNAIPAMGGFIAARKEVIQYLKKVAVPNRNSLANLPSNTINAMKGFELIQSECWRLQVLWENIRLLNLGRKRAGFDTGNSCSQVIPVRLPDIETARVLEKKLSDQGLIAHSVMNPSPFAWHAWLGLQCTTSLKPYIIQHFISTLVKLSDKSGELPCNSADIAFACE